MRRRSASLPAMLLSAAISGACQQAGDERNEPEAAGTSANRAQREVNLGTIVRGGERLGSFRFSNSTDAFLEIRRWRTTCECVRVTSLSIEVAPGKIAEITVSGHFSPEAQPGRVRVEVEGLDASSVPVLKFAVVMFLADEGETPAAG